MDDGTKKGLMIVGAIFVIMFLWQNAQKQSVFEGVNVESGTGFLSSIGGGGQLVLFGIIALLLVAFIFFPGKKD